MTEDFQGTPTPPAGVPTTPAQPPRRSRKGLWIALAIVAVLSCGCLTALAVGGGFWFTARQATEEQVLEIIAHYEAVGAALSELDSASADMSSAMPGDEADSMVSFAAVAGPLLDEAQSELDQAVSKTAELRDSEMKAALTEAADESMAALAAARTVLEEAEEFGQLMSELEAFSAQAEAGTDLMNDANEHIADEKWDAGKKSSAAAKAKYASALETVVRIEATYPDLDVAPLRAILGKRQEQADVAIRLAEHGAAKRWNDFNKAVDSYNKLNAAIPKMALPDWFDDPDTILGDMSAAVDAVDEHATAADLALARAEERFNAGQY